MTEATTTEKKSKTRRGRGEGSICQRSDGRWMARIGIGQDATGKRLTKTLYGKTKKEVADKLTAEASALLTGSSVNPGRMTLADLLGKWLEESAKPNTARGTYANYKRIVDSHVVPNIGGVKLSAVRPLHVQTLLSTLEKAEVGARTRQYVYVTLHRAFKVAMRWQLLTRNPCDGVTPPRVAKRQVKPLTAAQAKVLLEKAKSTRYYALYLLALTTGMRQGELFALSWKDVDLKRGVLQVRHSLEMVDNQLRLKEPKSESGRRQIALPNVASEALLDHKAKLLAEGLAACPYVFPDSDGGLVRRSNFLKWSWHKIRTAAKLEGVHFHDLRHSSASLMLADGVHMKSIQAILGHSTISMTMDTYAHLMPDSQRQAAATFDRLLG
jgi:integrase